MTGAIEFDATTGRCRIPRAVLASLLDGARGVPPPASLRDPLADAGILRDGRLHPALAEPLAEAADPDCRLTIFRTHHEGSGTRGSAELTNGAGLFAMETGGDRVDVLPVPPGFFPAVMARLLRLQPRPRLGFQPVLAPHALIEELLSEQPAARASAARYVAARPGDDATRHFATVLEHGPWRWTSTRVEWPAADGTVASRALHVWDSADGMAIFENRGGDRVAIDPIDSTTVFRLLTKILPTQAERLDLRGR